MLIQDREGFTLVEIVIAILILTVAVLGLASSTSQMLAPTGNAEIEFVALQAVEDRLALVSLDPRYGGLDTLYTGTDSVRGLPGASRATGLTRTQTLLAGGKVIDYWTVVVTVTGGGLRSGVSRKLVIGAP